MKSEIVGWELDGQREFRIEITNVIHDEPCIHVINEKTGESIISFFIKAEDLARIGRAYSR